MYTYLAGPGTARVKPSPDLLEPAHCVSNNLQKTARAVEKATQQLNSGGQQEASTTDWGKPAEGR